MVSIDEQTIQFQMQFSLFSISPLCHFLVLDERSGKWLANVCGQEGLSQICLISWKV